MYSSDANKPDGNLDQACNSSLSETDVGKANNRCSEDQLHEGMVLKKALVVFRHGARTPLFTIPNVPQDAKIMIDLTDMLIGMHPASMTNTYQKVTYEANELMVDMAETKFGINVIDAYSKGPRPTSQAEVVYSALVLKGGSVSGQLTIRGQQQTYSLGQVLKKDYVDHHKLIDPDFNKDQIYLKSTNMNRTVKSLCCVMAGLFGLESLQKIAPVQIPVAEEIDEVLVPFTSLCPNLQLYHLQSLKNAELESGTLHDRLAVEKSIGIDSTQQQLKWIEVRDDLVAREAHNFEIPKELEPHMAMIDRNATMQLYHSFCGSTEEDLPIACMLSCGKAINMFFEHLKMDSKEGGYQLYLYSCHDSTLMALLGAFGIFDEKWPPFAADLRLELYENKENEKFIKVSYLSKDVIARGCTDIYTPYETFLKEFSPLAVDKDAHAAACCCKKIEKIAQGNNINEVTDDS